ncbi:MalY/PatB family protein [Amnibacterium flavum]|uniref:cysteine-S-conjugate beta-lyase n=1 Tax=Amnibacterium flavum TaxID=2173173 RepID=A0A2V1HQF0_9MICO|nr:aminotransferase class I/II-fold pyridoxal phosphate-dependent enzyme [Amnibacterium flavum]PVZ94758.1 aminotransferase class I/II [Amnibacterium flavum]
MSDESRPESAAPLPHDYDAIERDSLARPDSRKWSLHEGTIGAWVAEMDFGTAPVVRRALHDAVDRGDLGYLAPATSARMSEAVADWYRVEYGWDLHPRHVHPVSDVMAAFNVAVSRYSAAGSAVIVPTPAYMPFLTFIPAIGREVIEVPGIVEDGRWRHDLEAVDAAFAAGAETLVLCNPHNPTGTALTRDELEAISEVVEAHGGRVFADEIHAALRYDGRHIPYASLSPATASHTITATSASKAWNLPGLKAAQLITSNDEDEAAYADFGFSVVHGASTPGVIAATVAFSEGRDWLLDTVGYLDGNRRELERLLAEHLPEIGYTPPDATYIAWLDCRRLGITGSPADFFREHAGVALTDGALCGRGYEGFVRLVFAMPRPILRDAVSRMGEAVRLYRT